MLQKELLTHMNINSKTMLCCIIGNPVEHSLSPTMHNAAYKKLGLNFIYVAFKVTDIKNVVLGIKSLGIKGVSVTVPHKVTVMPFLDKIDDLAKQIGAVNTIVNEDGKLFGYNTDAIGAIKALEEVTSLLNKKVVLLGAGGAARAIAFGLKQKDARVTILNRTIANAKELAQKINSDYGSLLDIKKIQDAEIVINATTTGMSPKIDETIVTEDYLNKNQIIFDIVYNPKETMLLKLAKKKGCKVIYGYKMLLYQAISQFELFTKKSAPIAIMEKELLSCLNS